MNQVKTSIFSTLFILITCFLSAQTPGPLVSTIDWDDDPTMSGAQASYNGVDDAEEAYNNARRNEETQLGFPANSLGNLNLPNQTAWDLMPYEEQALFILNEERAARTGLDYGLGPVKGVTFIGVEANIQATAQDYAQLLIDVDYQGSSYNGVSAAQRIDSTLNIGGSGCSNSLGTLMGCCHQHIPRSQNTGYWTFSNTSGTGILTAMIVERTIYTWIYDYGSAGLREMCLLQDDDVQVNSYDPYGFTDDYGDAGQEGFIGFGIAGGGPWQGSAHADIVVFNYFDPIPEANGCAYDCTSCSSNCDVELVVSGTPIQPGDYQAIEKITSAGTANSVISFKAGERVNLNAGFKTLNSATFEALIEDCYSSTRIDQAKEKNRALTIQEVPTFNSMAE